MQTFISFLAKSSLYRELFAIFAAKINDYEDIKVQIAERFCKETLITEISQVSPKRPERAEAPSPGQRPGLLWTQTCRPVRAKALKLQTKHKAFALTGRLADCHYTQGDALG